ncbi:MAG: cyclic nucleotide-binding domain-containing protein [Blastochloris sp.]|nr:cyclic nucleotide-binding domain-containing protein [Blastochloris sp.]
MVSSEGQEERHYQAGDIICSENERPDGLYIVKDGMVEIFHKLVSDQGSSEVHLGRVGVRGMFGEMGIIDHQPRSASARALGPTTLVFISRQAFQKHLEELPPWVAILVKTMVHRLREANLRLVRTMEAAEAGRLNLDRQELIISHGEAESKT